MAVTTTSSTGQVPQYQRFFIKELLKNLQYELKMSIGAKKNELMERAGATTASYFRANFADSSQVEAGVEGVNPVNDRQLVLSSIDVPLTQRIISGRISDVLSVTNYFDVIMQLAGLIGKDLAKDVDDQLRNAIIAGNIAANLTTIGTQLYAQATASFSGLASASASAGKLVLVDVLKALTQHKINKARKFTGDIQSLKPGNNAAPANNYNDHYLCFVPPAVILDLLQDTIFINASSYSNVARLYKGQVGDVFGGAFVEHTNPFTESQNLGQYTPTFITGTNSTGLIYSNIITGADAYGMVDIASQPAMNPELIVLDKADKSDPGNQRRVVTAKYFAGFTMLDPTFAVVLRSKSSVF
jgi:N4-gp56 family major capsid protein